MTDHTSPIVASVLTVLGIKVSGFRVGNMAERPFIRAGGWFVSADEQSTSIRPTNGDVRANPTCRIVALLAGSDFSSSDVNYETVGMVGNCDRRVIPGHVESVLWRLTLCTDLWCISAHRIDPSNWRTNPTPRGTVACRLPHPCRPHVGRLREFACIHQPSCCNCSRNSLRARLSLEPTVPSGMSSVSAISR